MTHPLRTRSFILIVITLILTTGCSAGVEYSSAAAWPAPAGNLPTTSPLPTITRTPFLPLPTSTHIPTITPSATPAPTETAQPTPTLEPTPEPTETPTEVWPPVSASVSYIAGYPQSYNLDCESRSSVDLAAFFGVHISEQYFVDTLPRSDNPDEGFVGNYNDYIGQIPPNSYGVHAGPIADHLTSYGLPARAVRGASWQDVQNEIANNRPVIVWVIAGLGNSEPVEYTALSGATTIVARNEHTVIVIGYDEAWVTVLDGGMVYSSTLQRFLNSWSVLGNMAVMAEPPTD